MAARSSRRARRSSVAASRAAAAGSAAASAAVAAAASGAASTRTALKEVADLTGGTYYPAESADQLEEVFAGLPTNLILKHEVVEISVVFVALGLLLAGGGLLLGRAWRPLP